MKKLITVLTLFVSTSSLVFAEISENCKESINKAISLNKVVLNTRYQLQQQPQSSSTIFNEFAGTYLVEEAREWESTRKLRAKKNIAKLKVLLNKDSDSSACMSIKDLKEILEEYNELSDFFLGFGDEINASAVYHFTKYITGENLYEHSEYELLDPNRDLSVHPLRVKLLP